MTESKVDTDRSNACTVWDGKERSCSLAEAIALFAYGDDQVAQRYAGLASRPFGEPTYPPGHEDAFGGALKVLQIKSAKAWGDARASLQACLINESVQGIVNGDRVGKDFWTGHSLDYRKAWLQGLAFWRSEIEAVLRPDTDGAEKPEKPVPLQAVRVKPARDTCVHSAISWIYSAAKELGCKPPNQKEIGAIAQGLMREQNKLAAKSRVSRLAADSRYDGFRGPVGKRVNGSLPAFSLELWRKSGREI